MDFVARKVMAAHGANESWIGLDDVSENGTFWENSDGDQTFPNAHPLWIGGIAPTGMGKCAILATMNRG